MSDMPETIIRKKESGELIRVRRFFNFDMDGRRHSINAGYLVTFRQALSIYLGTDDTVAFLIRKQWTNEIIPDDTAIGQFTNISILGEVLNIVALPVVLYDQEIKERENNKLRFGEKEVLRLGPPPTVDWIGNKWYGKGTYEDIMGQPPTTGWVGDRWYGMEGDESN